MFKDFTVLKPGMHIIITPDDKTPDMDTDIIIDDIINDKCWGSSILYGLSTTCDGYVIPFSWIKSFKIVS